ncbi:hypothetical protein C7M84_009210 [Penaeus vannamei]|uniref:Uncharacterized protein n=1 Tax=Penaeus vannamei TaxID=6689 RepID=A0A423T7I0_PENVA|nr:hypothetical protein C7M84_009210 [Penaeus vannamei]
MLIGGCDVELELRCRGPTVMENVPLLPVVALLRLFTPLELALCNHLSSILYPLYCAMTAGRSHRVYSEADGVPGGGARGGKGAKGAGGGVGRYGYRGISNSGGYEMTWEDIVLAMQLSAMCFGALLALCIVACCAYKICGPAQEEDWGSRYSVLKPAPRLPPELLREIYTLPTPTALSQASSAAANPSTATGADASGTPSHRGASGGKASGVTCAKMEGGPRVTSVSAEPVPNSTRGTATSLAHLPNGRPRGPPLGGDTTPATPPVGPRRPIPREGPSPSPPDS